MRLTGVELVRDTHLNVSTFLRLHPGPGWWPTYFPHGSGKIDTPTATHYLILKCMAAGELPVERIPEALRDRKRL
jgi:hypothetical protein